MQINVHRNAPNFIDVHKLTLAYKFNPHLGSLSQGKLSSVMLQLYIVTGCDYTSYISGLGKTTFLNYSFQHAEIITGTSPVAAYQKQKLAT